MKTDQIAGPRPLTNRETCVVLALLPFCIVDDFLLGNLIAGINQYVLTDYAKKALLIVGCLSTAPLRALVRRSFAAPDLPWHGAGWLNIHVLFFLAFLLLSGMLLHGTVLYLSFRLDLPAIAEIPKYNDDIVMYADLVLGLLLNAVAEEMFFRAVLIAVICRYVPNVGAGILIAALLFAAGHWSQGIVGTGAIVMFGVLYGYAYCLTRSIMLPILAHYIHNLFIFAP